MRLTLRFSALSLPFLFLLSTHVYAAQYLCVAKHAAWISISTDGKEIKSQTYDDADEKYIFSNNDGAWRAKEMQGEGWMYNQCDPTGTLCEFRPEGVSPTTLIHSSRISRNPLNDTFYVTGLRGDGHQIFVSTMAGRCSEF